MTCGLDLGILVVFLVQAELVCCLWTQRAQSFQNSNTYAGFQPDGSLSKFSSYPQNQVRQGFSPHSVQSRSFNTGPAVTSGSGPGLPRSSTQVVSQPAQSSVRLVKSSSLFKANRQWPSSPRSAAPKGAWQSFDGGPSVIQTQKNPSDIGSRSLPTWQGGTHHSINYPFNSSPSLQASRGSHSFRSVSPQSVAQEPSRTAATSFHNSKTGSSAILFGPAAPGPRGRSVQMNTNARGPAKRVFSNRRSEKQKARRLSPQIQTWKPTMDHQRESRPKSWLLTYKTSHNLAVPRSSTVGAPGQGFVSATVHEIPENFGGFAIRRL